MPLPEKDEMFNTRGKMLQNIIVSLGGRVAEELVFDDITTGASQDIRQATQTARDMVILIMTQTMTRSLSEETLHIQDHMVKILPDR